MRIGVRHCPELGNQQRHSGDEREAKLETMAEFDQINTRSKDGRDASTLRPNRELVGQA
jgi:hypothetical protein